METYCVLCCSVLHALCKVCQLSGINSGCLEWHGMAETRGKFREWKDQNIQSESVLCPKSCPRYSIGLFLVFDQVCFLCSLFLLALVSSFCRYTVVRTIRSILFFFFLWSAQAFVPGTEYILWTFYLHWDRWKQKLYVYEWHCLG